MAPLIFYNFLPSPPCRIALLACRNLNLDVELRDVDLVNKGTLSEDFVKINPQHCIPTIDDDGFVLWESRAIAIYLVNKHHPNGHPLYPNDLKQRAMIDQRLQFDTATLYSRLRKICWPAIWMGVTTIDDTHRQQLYEAIGFLNTFLEGNKYVTGSNEPTLADLSLSTTVANIIEVGADLSKYPNVVAWFERVKSLPGQDENLAGAKLFGNRVKSTLKEKL